MSLSTRVLREFETIHITGMPTGEGLGVLNKELHLGDSIEGVLWLSPNVPEITSYRRILMLKACPRLRAAR